MTREEQITHRRLQQIPEEIAKLTAAVNALTVTLIQIAPRVPPHLLRLAERQTERDDHG